MRRWQRGGLNTEGAFLADPNQSSNVGTMCGPTNPQLWRLRHLPQSTELQGRRLAIVTDLQGGPGADHGVPSGTAHSSRGALGRSFPPADEWA
jgi:hypothetical protein